MKIHYISLDEKYRLGKYFWKVQSPTATIYLLGTAHIVPKKMFPLKTAIIRAFDSCDYFVCEALIDDTYLGTASIDISLLSNPHYSYPVGDNLYKHFSPDEVVTLKKELIKAKLCPPALARQFHLLTPTGIRALIVSGSYEKAGIDPSKLGIDHFFIKRAQRREKPILELEGIAFQQNLLTKMGKEVKVGTNQDNTTLPTFSTLERQLQHYLCKRYARGASFLYHHLDFLSGYMPEDHVLVGNRNEGMAEKINDYLQTDKSYFIAVGALHLVGNNSIISLLEQSGYTPRRIL